jgi:hypothetical protein
MKSFIASHRAGLGVAALIALPLYLWLPEDTGDAWGDVAMAVTDVAMIAIVILGGYALFTSPYLGILYREAPLRRATTGVTDLDERELALRDRAAGLTYNLFAAANVTLLFGTAIALRMGLFTLDGRMLTEAVIPYAFFSTTLPVLMLEWFEPSLWYVQPALEEEE